MKHISIPVLDEIVLLGAKWAVGNSSDWTYNRGFDNERLGKSVSAGLTLDRIACLTLFDYFIGQKTPCLYDMPSHVSDVADFILKGSQGRQLTVNLKVSAYTPRNDDVSHSHLPIKTCEISDGLHDIYLLSLLHLQHRTPHMHLVCWETQGNIRQGHAIRTIPNTDGCEGYWIASHRLKPMSCFRQYVRNKIGDYTYSEARRYER